MIRMLRRIRWLENLCQPVGSASVGRKEGQAMGRKGNEKFLLQRQ
jgi:hypothetical protein